MTSLLSNYSIMKLHLGCGQHYIKGYSNIDFPSSKHTVQSTTVADLYADITKLRYPKNSIDEIRLHHVYEHFTRPTALALLSSWWSWLKPGGILRIEVPDFDKTASRILNPFINTKQKYVALRHIFGSQEAPWANHYEGWSEDRLKTILLNFGFQPIKTQRNSWRGTYNIEIFATKVDQVMEKKQFEHRAESVLTNYLLDKSPSEIKLLQVWMKIYNEQIHNTWAK